jgi:hypothetical protein
VVVQSNVFVLQLLPSQFASFVHCTQVPALHAGSPVIPSQSVAVSHPVHSFVSVSHRAAVGLLQSEFAMHSTHSKVSALQTGVSSTHAVEFCAVHCTHV